MTNESQFDISTAYSSIDDSGIEGDAQLSGNLSGEGADFGLPDAIKSPIKYFLDLDAPTSMGVD